MSTGFITETEIAEARKKRQEEWEKVRTPDQPLELPEEPYDSRSLYERLKEQKMKKDLEYEEAHKLKNLIRGLDDDEVEFLDLVDRTKMDAEKKQMMEEEKELNDFRQRVVTLQEKSLDEKIQSEKTSARPKTSISANRPSQKSALSGVVIRKRKNGEIDQTPPLKKSTNGEDESKLPPATTQGSTTQTTHSGVSSSTNATHMEKGALKCIGVLPGIGRYRESSDSELSTDSEEEFEQAGKYDLVGRANCKNAKKKGETSD
ncbi:unnamed protein product [Hermetia illucens]|uniref:FAM192A/Fyv6 N-terminal domain-containing protein n=1 Tax=Hermetia illucens TaxID=343691 RepID=A0A7R8UYT6_HERIL|nr:PSME3-interacting protein [Hermetia illucens]CAD7089533.1 unnamed protein product [Hermetia illucens]